MVRWGQDAMTGTTKDLLAHLQGKEYGLGTHGEPPNSYSSNSIASIVWGNGEGGE